MKTKGIDVEEFARKYQEELERMERIYYRTVKIFREFGESLDEIKRNEILRKLLEEDED